VTILLDHNLLRASRCQLASRKLRLLLNISHVAWRLWAIYSAILFLYCARYLTKQYLNQRVY
jgi:hypothetical protein